MCCTAAGWLGPAFPPPAGLRTVGPLVLDMTAAAAAPETPNTGTDITLLQYATVHVKQTQTYQKIHLHHIEVNCVISSIKQQCKTTGIKNNFCI